MRQFFVAAAAATVLVGVSFAQTRADDVVLKGTHLCCDMCVSNVGKTLKGVDGVTGAKCDKDKKTVSFTAKDEKVAAAALKALAAAGFFGTATKDDKEFKIDVPEVKKGTKADTVTVTDVHVCCGNCKDGIAKALKDLKVEVEYDGDTAMKTLKVTGKDLDGATVLEALRKGGYNGTIGK